MDRTRVLPVAKAPRAATAAKAMGTCVSVVLATTARMSVMVLRHVQQMSALARTAHRLLVLAVLRTRLRSVHHARLAISSTPALVLVRIHYILHVIISIWVVEPTELMELQHSTAYVHILLCLLDHVAVEINECDSNPCANGATCEDQINAFVCHCAPNYYGTRCMSEDDDCSGNVTELCGRGTCIDGASADPNVANYSCECDDGWIQFPDQLECTKGRMLRKDTLVMY